MVLFKKFLERNGMCFLFTDKIVQYVTFFETTDSNKGYDTKMILLNHIQFNITKI